VVESILSRPVGWRRCCPAPFTLPLGAETPSGFFSQEQAQRKALGGVNATQEIDQQVNRQIKVLEARLDKALVKFNEALSHNKDLRLEIDHLRKERYAAHSSNPRRELRVGWV
jgi:hypothetical protein